ncbi:MAG: lysophospholipase [Proteobacteria bacterium]|nr:lysophospholipase [Pseudomonadota bacterium]
MRWLAPLFAAASVAACAPTVMPMGPPVVAPRLVADRIVAADGAELPLRRWLPDGAPKAVVLALHGFNDYSNAFAAPGAAWTADGIATYAYDQRGFGAAPHPGLWPGTESLVADLDAASAVIAAAHPGVPLFLLGESMGAAVILAAATLSPDGANAQAQGTILAAPAVRGRETLGPFARGLLWLAAHTVPWLDGRPGSNFGFRPSDNFAMLRELARDPLVIHDTRIDSGWGLFNLMDDALAAAPRFGRPALILLGANDNLIPDGPSALLLARLPPAAPVRRRAAYYERGYHLLLRDLGAPVVSRDVAQWILTRTSDPGAPLPSGADGAGLKSALHPE